MTTLAPRPVWSTEPRATRAGGAEAAHASSYTALAKRIKAGGLLERRHGWYALRGIVLAALLVIGVAQLLMLGHTWWQLLIAVYFSVVFTQIAYLAHDSAHKQIFTSCPLGEVVSRIISTLFVGLVRLVGEQTHAASREPEHHRQGQRHPARCDRLRPRRP